MFQLSLFAIMSVLQEAMEKKIDPTFQLPNPKKYSYVQFNSEYLAYNFFLSFNNLKYHS